MRFLLACEGQSDAGLIPHIQRLIIESGETEVDGDDWFRGSPLANKIRRGLDAAEDAKGMVDMLFVHRDADRAGADARFQEIANAVGDVAGAPHYVSVIPVRMTEAWLILDENAIRKAVGKPNGRTPLDLPTPREAERRADPKGILSNAFLAASEATGRRRKKIERDFARLRRQLLVNLPIDGPLAQLTSWAKFRDDTLHAIATRHTASSTDEQSQWGV